MGDSAGSLEKSVVDAVESAARGGFPRWPAGWRLVVLLSCFVGLWVSAVWWRSTSWAEQEIDRLARQEHSSASTTAAIVAANIGQWLAHVQSIPVVVASQPSVGAALRRFGPDAAASPLPLAERSQTWRSDAELRDLSAQFHRIVRNTGLDSIFLVNAAGDCVATGFADGNAEFIGTNYGDREYFAAARRGRQGHQFAVGRVSGAPSLYYSAPVFVDDRFLGAVVARTDATNFARLLVDNDVFVTDRYGVIIQAGDPTLALQAVPDASVAGLAPAEKESRYKRSAFTAIDLQPGDSYGEIALMRWNRQSTPYVWTRQTSPDGEITVNVLRPLDAIAKTWAEHWWWFGAVALIGLLLGCLTVIGVSFFLAARKHQRDLSELNAVLKRQALTDSLTGCANRRSLLEALGAERRRWRRYRRPFCVLSLDLDHFKAVNDIHGHLSGDAVLRYFASVVQSMLRPSDLLGRMGGEEFAVFLPETIGAEAANVAERIRATLKGSPARFGGTEIAVTVSIGVAQWRADDDQNIERFLGRADWALYAAKSGGRDRVQRETSAWPAATTALCFNPAR
jgi:diguanylate cyclase (GGDEF)-like protein